LLSLTKQIFSLSESGNDGERSQSFSDSEPKQEEDKGEAT